MWSIVVGIHLIIFLDLCIGLISLDDIGDAGDDLFLFLDYWIEGDVDVIFC